MLVERDERTERRGREQREHDAVARPVSFEDLALHERVRRAAARGARRAGRVRARGGAGRRRAARARLGAGARRRRRCGARRRGGGEEVRRLVSLAVARRGRRGGIGDSGDRTEGLWGLRVGLRRARRVGVHAGDGERVRVADLEEAVCGRGAERVLGRAVVGSADAVERVLALAVGVGTVVVAPLEAERVAADEPGERNRSTSLCQSLNGRMTHSVQWRTW